LGSGSSSKGDFKDSSQKNSPSTPFFKGPNSGDGRTARETPSEASPTREIKCFKCLGVGHMPSHCSNRKVLVMTPRGDLESESEEENNEEA